MTTAASDLVQLTAPIIGAKRPDQLHDTLAGTAEPLPADELVLLDDISAFARSRAGREV